MKWRFLVVAVAVATAAGVAPAAQSPAQPVNVVILVDVSSSLHLCPAGVAGLPSSTPAGSGTTQLSMQDQRPIPPAVDFFTLRGLAASDRVRVGAIARKISISDAMPGDSAALRKAWRALFDMPPVEWMGPSPIWDATADAVRILSSDPGRRSVVLITDGQASANRQSYVEVGAAAKTAGVAIHAVGEQTPLFDLIGKDPLAPLRQLAEVSGGRFVLDPATPSPPCFRRDPAKYLTAALGGLR